MPRIVDSDSEDEDTVDGRAKRERNQMKKALEEKKQMRRLKAFSVAQAEIDQNIDRRKEQCPGQARQDRERDLRSLVNQFKEQEALDRIKRKEMRDQERTRQHRQRRSELVRVNGRDNRKVTFDHEPITNTTAQTATSQMLEHLSTSEGGQNLQEMLIEHLSSVEGVNEAIKQFQHRFAHPGKLGIDCLTKDKYRGGVLNLFEGENPTLLSSPTRAKNESTSNSRSHWTQVAPTTYAIPMTPEGMLSKNRPGANGSRNSSWEMESAYPTKVRSD